MVSPNTVVYCAGSQEFTASVRMPVFSCADKNSVPLMTVTPRRPCAQDEQSFHVGRTVTI